MTLSIAFDAIGKAQPQGSIKVINNRGPHPVLTSDNPGLHEWRTTIGWHAIAAMEGHKLVERPAPVGVRALFRRPRPASAPRRVVRPTTMPDVDKLARALLDALTGICYRDDAQVVALDVAKAFCAPGEAPGVYVQLWEIA